MVWGFDDRILSLATQTTKAMLRMFAPMSRMGRYSPLPITLKLVVGQTTLASTWPAFSAGMMPALPTGTVSSLMLLVLAAHEAKASGGPPFEVMAIFLP